MQYHADYSKAQMKIQEMAFVLVAFVVFFGIVLLFYVSFRGAGLRGEAGLLQEEKAREMAQKLAGSPELGFQGCSKCIDFDKAFVLKNQTSYKNFWQLDYLKIEKVYPADESECTRANYPNCGSITIKSIGNDIGTPSWAYVALCRQEFEQGGYIKCELGRVYASGRIIS